MVYHLGPFEGKAMYAWNGWCDVWWLTQMKASRKIRIFWHTHSHIIFIHLCRRNCIIPSLELLDNLNMYYVDEFMLVTYFYIMRNIFLHIPSTITDLVFIFGCCFSSVIFSLQGCYAGVSNFSFTWHDFPTQFGLMGDAAVVWVVKMNANGVRWGESAWKYQKDDIKE